MPWLSCGPRIVSGNSGVEVHPDSNTTIETSRGQQSNMGSTKKNSLIWAYSVRHSSKPANHGPPKLKVLPPYKIISRDITEIDVAKKSN